MLTRPADTAKTRFCTRCKQYRAKKLFCAVNSRPDGLSLYCRACRSVEGAKYRANPQNRAKKRLYCRNYDLQKNYGMSVTDYQKKWVEQGGTCAICGKPPKNRALSVDHDHSTGLVRGLLCGRCNRFLAPLEDQRFRLAAEPYLRRYGSVN